MKRLVYALALIAILLMNSCIKENFENCNVKVRLLFSYFGDGDSQIFLDKNNKVNLYVYDTSHEIVLTKEINYQKLLEFQGTYLDLPPGDYNIVCWSNLHGSTQVDAKSFTDSKIDHLVNTKDNKYVEPIDSLYYGTYKLNVPQTYKLAKDTLISDIIPFEAAHINFEIAVRENGTTSNASDKYTIVMEGLPSSSDFTKVTNPTTCAYLLSLDKADGALSYTQFNSMRFPNDNQIVVKRVHHLLYRETGDRHMW